jgi:hypothetical protein
MLGLKKWLIGWTMVTVKSQSSIVLMTMDATTVILHHPLLVSILDWLQTY